MNKMKKEKKPKIEIEFGGTNHKNVLKEVELVDKFREYLDNFYRFKVANDYNPEIIVRSASPKSVAGNVVEIKITGQISSELRSQLRQLRQTIAEELKTIAVETTFTKFEERGAQVQNDESPQAA